MNEELTLAQLAYIDGEQCANNLLSALRADPGHPEEPPEATLAAYIADLTGADKASDVYDRLAGFCEVVAPLIRLGMMVAESEGGEL